MNLFADGLRVFLQNQPAIAELGLILGGSALIITAVLWRADAGTFSTAELFSLGAAGWMSLSILTAASIFLADFIYLAWLILLAFATAGIFALIFIAPRIKRLKGMSPILIALFALLFISIFLRLAFPARTVLPLYFDSAEHYRIIKVLIQEFESTPPARTLTWPAPTYYHLGFHVVTAILSSALRVDPKTMILLLGQLVLACIPISFYFIVNRAAKSSLGGLFAVILAGFGWYMPAHAVNWGKYPALTSLLTIQFSLGLAYWLATDKTSRTKPAWMLLALSVLASLLAHTRSVIVIGIFAISWLIAVQWDKLPRVLRLLILGLVSAVLAAFAAWVNSTSLKTTFDPYLVKGSPVTVIVLLLAFFALKVSPRVLFCSLLSMALMLGSLFVPMRGLPGFGDLTLLDRPFVEMTLFVPLAMIGGVGFAGLFHFLKKVSTWQKIVAPAFAVLLVIALLVNAGEKYDFYPSSCCQIVGQDDMAALDWLNKNLPENSGIAIASAEMNVQLSGFAETYTGIDAGVWIAPLTGRTTKLIPFTSDFTVETVHAQLCEAKIDYIYVGKEKQSFDRQRLSARPDWYRVVFYLPTAQIDEIIGCT